MFRKKLSGHLRTGKRGEDLAVWHLRLLGYQIIERNFRCPLGEIDIIARKGKTLVFVEVRARSSGSLQHPLDTIDAVKVFRSVQAARKYLLGFRPPLPYCRFDVIGITPERRFPFIRLHHIRDSFNITSASCRQGCRREIGRKKRKSEKSGEWRTVNGRWRFRGRGR